MQPSLSEHAKLQQPADKGQNRLLTAVAMTSAYRLAAIHQRVSLDEVEEVIIAVARYVAGDMYTVMRQFYQRPAIVLIEQVCLRERVET